MKRATLADVAARAGLSKTAVSLILNDRPIRISTEAAQRARDAARELNYRPNPAARSLRLKKTRTVGFISDDVTITRYASAMIRGALYVAEQHDHTVLIAETGGDPDRREQVVQAMLDRRPDGLVFGLMGAKEIDVPDSTKGVPVVMLNGNSSAKHPSVVPAEFEAGTQIAELLVESGHRRIGIVGYPPPVLFDPRISSTIGDRLAGIEAVLDRSGITVAAKVEHRHWEPHHGYQATRQILHGYPDITALLCMNDRLAFGAYQALHDHRLTIPTDISVASFDDDEIAAYLRPGLTTARIPYEEMGRQAMRLLLHPGAEGAHHVPMPIQERSSIATLLSR